jgi:hypothetical protein
MRAILIGFLFTVVFGGAFSQAMRFCTSEKVCPVAVQALDSCGSDTDQIAGPH